MPNAQPDNPQPAELATRLEAVAAPGDKARGFARLNLEVHAITEPGAAFDEAYARLSDAFAGAGELETRTVLLQRLERGTATLPGGSRCRYRLLALRDATNGTLAALRDHSVLQTLVESTGKPCTFVHLSHALVLPNFRGQGVGAWLRTLPVLDAQDEPFDTEASLTLIAEMEHPEPNGETDDPARLHRLRVYEQAGFRMVDPAAVPYAQPSFVPGETEPLPMRLVVRRFGRGDDQTLPASEARATVAALYRIYALDLEAAAMRRTDAVLRSLPTDQQPIALLPPTQT